LDAAVFLAKSMARVWNCASADGTPMIRRGSSRNAIEKRSVD